jgi:hypothetical protein
MCLPRSVDFVFPMPLQRSLLKKKTPLVPLAGTEMFPGTGIITRAFEAACRFKEGKRKEIHALFDGVCSFQVLKAVCVVRVA